MRKFKMKNSNGDGTIFCIACLKKQIGRVHRRTLSGEQWMVVTEIEKKEVCRRCSWTTVSEM